MSVFNARDNNHNVISAVVGQCGRDELYATLLYDRFRQNTAMRCGRRFSGNFIECHVDEAHGDRGKGAALPGRCIPIQPYRG